jgi:hypothetical protein
VASLADLEAPVAHKEAPQKQQVAHSIALEAPQEQQVAHSTTSIAATKPSVYHSPLVGMGHSILAADRAGPVVAYTSVSVAAIRLTTKLLAYHSPVGTEHSIPVTVVLAELEAYTLASAARVLAQDSVCFAVSQKGSEMWMYRIWNKMIGPALTQNYNLGSTLFVVLEDVHNPSRKYQQAHEECYTAHNAIAMTKSEAVRPAAPVVSSRPDQAADSTVLGRQEAVPSAVVLESHSSTERGRR